MASGDINLKLDADQHALVRGVLAADDRVKDLIRNTTKLGTAGKKAGKEMNDGFKDFMKTAGSIAAGMGLAGGIKSLGMGVINQFKREIDHIKQQQARASATQMTAGEQRNAMLLNLAAPGQNAGKLDRIVSDLSKGKYQAKRTAIMAAMGGPLSGRGALSLDEMKGAVGLGLHLEGLAGAAAPMGLTAGAIMDIRKLDPRITNKGALGFAMGVGQASRVTEYGKYLSALPPVLASGKTKGFSLKDSATMFAYMTQAGGDTEGTISASGTINFQKALNLATTTGTGLLPYRGPDRTGKLVTKWGTTKSGGMGALREIQEAWPNMTDDKRKLLSVRMGGKAKTQGPVGMLLGRDPAAEAMWNTAAAGIVDPTSPTAARPVDDYLKVAGAGKDEPVRMTSRIFDRITEEFQLNDPNKGMADVMRKGINQIMADAPGASELGNRFRAAVNEFDSRDGTVAPLEAGLKTLRRFRRSMTWRQPTYTATYALGGAPVPAATQVANPHYSPESDEKMVELIDAIYFMIQEMKSDKTQKVEVVGGSPPAPNSQGE